MRGYYEESPELIAQRQLFESARRYAASYLGCSELRDAEERLMAAAENYAAAKRCAVDESRRRRAKKA